MNITHKNDYILVVGGSNVDIQGKSYENIMFHDSNPGNITISYGGVGRNISENLSRLGLNINFISVFGGDEYSKLLIDNLKSLDIDIKNSYVSKKDSSSMYLSISNKDGQMEIALSSMDLLKKLDKSYIEKKQEVFNKAKLILLDANLTKETIEFISKQFYKKSNIYFESVSSTKILKVENVLKYIHTIKMNKEEAESLTKINIKDEKDLTDIGKALIDKGVKNIIITLGSKGVFFINEKENFIIENSKKIKIKNDTGAGDAFFSGYVYGIKKNKTIKDCVFLGMEAAKITLEDNNTTSSNLNENNISKAINKGENNEN